MRPAVMFLIATVLSTDPRIASAQVTVTSPAAGAQSGYRTTTVSWNPIPGATSYHLEIDDDPNFGSPEVNVTVAGTSYKLSGERLELHGQQAWAAYVRINGKRWNANTFTPSYFQLGLSPALAVNSQNLVYLAFNDVGGPIQLATSSDWTRFTRLSLADTFNSGGLNLAVDEHDVAHAAWFEQRPTELWVPYYTRSSTGWNLMRIPGTTAGPCSEGSLVTGGGQVDLFYDACVEGIDRWTTTDGLAFARTRIPNNTSATSVSAGRDAFANLFVASERDTVPYENLKSSLQSSSDGWTPHTLGRGRFPSLAVTPAGELHVLKWAAEDDGIAGTDFLYSNSLRGFQTWTKLPTESTASFDQDVLPLIVDETGGRLYAALPALEGIQLCSAPYTGRSSDTGTSWSCATVGNGGHSPDLALAPDGTLHLAWTASGVAYANSLGSFLATNSTPQVSFGTPSNGPSAVTVPVRLSDADGDELAGHIQVGRYQPVMSFIGRGTTEKILDRYTLAVDSASASMYDVGGSLQFRILGTATWSSALNRSAVTIPAQVEIRDRTGQIIGGFFIAGWDGTGATIVKNGFVPYQKLTFDGALPSEIDISMLPAGASMVAIGVSDRSISSFAAQAFTKTSGQTRLLLTKF
jgi:hypothetical protein